MNKNTYHFEHLRLHYAPQTRIYSQSNSTGFNTKEDLISFCKKLGFNFSIYYYDREGKKELVYEDEI